MKAAKLVVRAIFYVLLIPMLALPFAAMGLTWLWYWCHNDREGWERVNNDPYD